MPLRYQIEDWQTYWPDAEPLWKDHWLEVGLNQDTIPLDVDKERYALLDAQGKLHIITMRDDDGELQGYYLAIVDTHLHYRTTLHAYLDVFWLHPAHRRGLAGYKLFQVVKDTLKARGVVKHIQGHKLHVHGKLGTLFERLGYHKIEHVYSTLLQEE